MKLYLNIDPSNPKPDDDPENTDVYEPTPTVEEGELEDEEEVRDPRETGAAMRPVISAERDGAEEEAKQP